MFKETVDFIRRYYGNGKFIPLHEPRFWGKEKEYLNNCIDSTFVSSVGEYVDRFEKMMAEYTGAKYAVATTNGTLGLHMSLLLAGVKRGDVVISQPLSFIATANAIAYIGAEHLFLDVDKETMGLSPSKMEEYLSANAERRNDGQCYLKKSGQRIGACVPMHSFGHPVKIQELAKVCEKFGIVLVEDAAESLGSKVGEKQTGTFGKLGVYSFNGNKTVTCGGGGIIVTDDQALAKRAKHLTTQAKVPHRWDFVHDEIGYNYRLPNLNAALACAQLEQLDGFLANKREMAEAYEKFFADKSIRFVKEPPGTKSNYWLCAVLLSDRKERDGFLTFTNDNGVMTRPAWALMQKLKMFESSICGNLDNALWLEDRLVNIPSSVRPKS
ncbi:MAG TPA: LegC family aminotransferase [Bacteroidia bacterium]|nr:LegC family aminotransferase [Bacteroidia bacterium]